jgi:hypothetical protein
MGIMLQDTEMQRIFAHADDVLMSDSGDMKVLMSMETGQFVELNGTGRAIWELTDGNRSLAQIAAALQDSYDVEPDECASEVQAFFAGLLTENLVTLQA